MNFAYKIYLIRLLIIRFISNLFMGFKLRLFSIEFGSKINFYGETIIYKRPGSIINLGNNLTFRSTNSSNLIGINRKCMISVLLPDAKIIIGDNCGFSGTVIGAFTSIILEDNVRCGANTLITDSDWHLDDPRSGIPSPILIKKNVWLGEGSKVLKGVTIGENSVIGAGSIVTKNIPANVIAAGNPCKVLKNIEIEK
jgi:acetyltransferase-like isoleucine patch superfamily enzyme